MLPFTTNIITFRKEYKKAERWEISPVDSIDFLLQNLPYTIMMTLGRLIHIVHLFEVTNIMDYERMNDISNKLEKLEQLCTKRRLVSVPE